MHVQVNNGDYKLAMSMTDNCTSHAHGEHSRFLFFFNHHPMIKILCVVLVGMQFPLILASCPLSEGTRHFFFQVLA
jgi:hypothetical protein